jgi:GT2 family glycosyltransferase
MSTRDAEIGVVVPCHHDRQWPLLRRSIESVLAQRPAPARVIVAVDHNEPLRARLRDTYPQVTVVANRYPRRGVSGNRNSGARLLDTPLIALLDGDAAAEPGWLAAPRAPFVDPSVCGVGGAITPDWAGPRPRWVPEEFLWAWGGAYAGLPTTAGPVRNVWSASMAVRAEAFRAVGGFRVDFGKVGEKSRPEDTDLCLRMSHATGGTWWYAPDARVRHPVGADKALLRYFLGRCYQEGRGKIALARLNHGPASLSSERGYLLGTVPRAVLRGATAPLRGNAAALLPTAAMLAGVGAAGCGALVELTGGRRVAAARGRRR